MGSTPWDVQRATLDRPEVTTKGVQVTFVVRIFSVPTRHHTLAIP